MKDNFNKNKRLYFNGWVFRKFSILHFPFSIAILSLFSCFLLQSCFDTPYKEGRVLYTNHCEGCHGDNGVGLLALIPPVAGSDYLVKNRDSLACIIQYGLQGEIEVNGRKYNEMMPGLGFLKPAEVANLINYINTSFGNKNPVVSIVDVEAALQKCAK